MATTFVVGTPDEGEISARLRSAGPLWERLLDTLQSHFGPLTPEWKKYKKDAPWTLRLLRKKRCLVYLAPDDPPVATLVLGGKAVALLPEPLATEVRTGKKYPEGWALRITVTGQAEIETAVTAIRAKTAT